MSNNDNSVNMTAPSRGYHHGDLRAALLDAGLDLLKSGSAETLSLREVARRVGVSPTAVYRHFPDKAALLKELCIRGALELAQAQAQAPHLPQGVAGRDPVFCGDVREQGTGAFLLAAHPLSAVDPLSRSWLGFSAAS